MEPNLPLLEVENLVTAFDTDLGPLRAVDDVSFSLRKGETIGVVGESGCGKSVMALSILRLLPERISKILQGRVTFNGQDLSQLSVDEMRTVRGNQISMIFQDPMTSLNPVFRVSDQIEEAIRLHQKVSPKQARELAIEALRLVGIPDSAKRARDYPHQFSGGQRQRVMIAMALSCRPQLLIADEPTTALDVTIQSQILDLIFSLKQELQMSVMFISHDLAVISEIAQRVLIMYAGLIVEAASSEDIFKAPKHPYTKGLLQSLPQFSGPQGHAKDQPLPTIPGNVPDLRQLPSGCRFSDRCPFVTQRCHLEEPPLEEIETGHHVRCWEWRSV